MILSGSQIDQVYGFLRWHFVANDCTIFESVKSFDAGNRIAAVFLPECEDHFNGVVDEPVVRVDAH